MVSPSSQVIDIGNLCFYNEKTVIVLAISNQLGFNKYTVMDLDTGMSDVAHKHELKKI